MKRMVFEAFGFCCIFLSAILLLISSGSGKWMTTCFSLTSVIIKPEAMMKFFPHQPLSSNEETADPSATVFKSNDISPKFNLAQFRSRPDVYQEEITLFKEISQAEICASQGFLQYCIYGKGFFRFGNYILCMSSDVEGRPWSYKEKLSLALFSIAFIFICATAILLVVKWTEVGRHIKFIANLSEYTIPFLTFAAGSIVLVGIFFVMLQSIIYNNDKSTFYNDLVGKLFTIYSGAVKINWRIKDPKAITDAHAWARNLVEHMSSISVDRDFYLMLAAAGLLYMACSFFIFRPRTDHISYSPLATNGRTWLSRIKVFVIINVIFLTMLYHLSVLVIFKPQRHVGTL